MRDDYKVTADWMGPVYFMPNQCIRQTSWTIPKKTSPIIAMIEHGNDVEKDVQKYYKALTKKMI